MNNIVTCWDQVSDLIKIYYISAIVKWSIINKNAVFCVNCNLKRQSRGLIIVNSEADY